MKGIISSWSPTDMISTVSLLWTEHQHLTEVSTKDNSHEKFRCSDQRQFFVLSKDESADLLIIISYD